MLDWDTNIETLASGTGTYLPKKWLKDSKDEICEHLSICPSHTNWSVALHIPDSKRYEKVMALTARTWKYIKPTKDKISLKISM